MERESPWCDDVCVRESAGGGTAPGPRLVHVVSLLAVVAVPVVGWFAADWSGPTTLVVYWFETLAICLSLLARIAIHQRWSPRRGHFRYRGPSAGGRGVTTATFISGFAVTSLTFCAGHAIFLTAILALLRRNGHRDLAEIDWRSVGFGILAVALFLTVDFLMDLLTLRRWSFRDIEKMTDQALSRVVVIHLTLIFGFVAVGLTDAPSAFFGVFVVLKSMASLSYTLPQWQPAEPPQWLSRAMNRVPSARPGKSFEEFWSEERDDENQRRELNEAPWTGR